MHGWTLSLFDIKVIMFTSGNISEVKQFREYRCTQVGLCGIVFRASHSQTISAETSQ